MMRLPAPIALLGCLSLAACGGGASASEAQIHAGFARIQRAEARLEDATRHAGRCPAGCEDAARAEAAAGEICDTARELEDADALLRCEAAREQVRASHPGDCCER